MEIKNDYAFKCECGKLIEIDIHGEHKDFFSGHDKENEVSLLVGECPKCGHEISLRRDDIGKTVLRLYRAKFKFRWEE